MARFPNLTALAGATLDEVLGLWTGLGYYSRARNLHRAAAMVRDRHGGAMPRELDALVALPGIGLSTAGAILALSHGDRQPILDGNVKRVLCRYHGIDGWPGQSRVQRDLWALAERHTPREHVAAYTQAIMDLGATLCARSRPLCAACPLEADCAARREGSQARLPAPRPRRAVPQRETAFLVLRAPDGALLLERRPPAGIWGGLWCFPECDPGGDIDVACRTRFGVRPAGFTRLAPISHGFTHFKLDVHPILVDIGDDDATAVAEVGERRWFPPGVAEKPGARGPGEAPDRAARERVFDPIRRERTAIVGHGRSERAVSTPSDWTRALAHLRRRDRALKRVIDIVGPSRPARIGSARTPFVALLRAIVHQQLSGKAADSIHRRLLGLFPNNRPSARALLALDDAVLRAAGLSRSKVLAVRDLAAKVAARRIPSRGALASMEDEAIIERLTEIRGIGRWSVEMLLIFGPRTARCAPRSPISESGAVSWCAGVPTPCRHRTSCSRRGRSGDPIAASRAGTCGGRASSDGVGARGELLRTIHRNGPTPTTLGLQLLAMPRFPLRSNCVSKRKHCRGTHRIVDRDPNKACVRPQPLVNQVIS